MAESHREDVAGRGTVAELLARSAAVAEMLPAGAPWGAAGRGAVAELLAGSAMAKRMAAPWRRAIGKMLLPGAPWRRAIRKMLLTGAPL